MILTSKITMDILKKESQPLLDMVQGDKNSRAVEWSLLADGTPWPIPAGAQARLNCILPDGTGKLYGQFLDEQPVCIIGENSITTILPAEVLQQAGAVMLSVSLWQNDTLLSTFPVMVEVHPGIPETLIGRQ